MKKVLSSQMVVHAWMNQTQNEARNPDGSLYFKDDKIYSSSSNIVIARHVTNEAGEKAVLLSTPTYSDKTSRHQSLVSQAIYRTIHILYVPDADNKLIQNLESWKGTAKSIGDSLKKARRPEIYLAKIASIKDKVLSYHKFFNLVPDALLMQLFEFKDVVIPRNHSLTDKKFAEIAEEIGRISLLKQIEREVNSKIEKEVADFYSFKKSYLKDVKDGLELIRYNSKTNKLETTQNVEIPLETAKVFYKLIKTGYIPSDFKLLNRCPVYELNTWYIIVGSHKISLKEIKRVAIELNFDKS